MYGKTINDPPSFLSSLTQDLRDIAWSLAISKNKRMIKEVISISNEAESSREEEDVQLSGWIVKVGKIMMSKMFNMYIFKSNLYMYYYIQ